MWKGGAADFQTAFQSGLSERISILQLTVFGQESIIWTLQVCLLEAGAKSVCKCVNPSGTSAIRISCTHASQTL